MDSIQFNKGMSPNHCIYPFTKQTLKDLEPCRLVNPKEGKSYGYSIPKDFDIEKSTIEIINVRDKVNRGKFPHEFMQCYYPFKDLFGLYEFPKDIFDIENLRIQRPKGLANVVHMDSPNDMPKMVLKWLTHPAYQQNQNVKEWTPDYINFLETIPDMEAKIAISVKESLDKAFEMKYFFGVARPEEVAEALLKVEKNMTAYPEGSPNHPSFPAGHASAAAGGVVPIIDNFPSLYSFQLRRILDTAYSWAMFRSFAGVHHAYDNILGLMANGLDKFMDRDLVEKFKK